MKNIDRCIGAYAGAAIGDAMGGPVEGYHFETIKGFFQNGVDTLLEYKEPYLPWSLKPGYALHEEAGSVTDDTFIRKDLTLFLLNNPAPYSAHQLACWLADNAEWRQWWPPVVQVIHSIKAGEADAKTSGMTHAQGGGIGWWTPIGIVHAGNPAAAAALARELCTIWKAPLEQDFCAAHVAAVAVAVTDGSTWEDVVDALLTYGGPLSKKLLTRAIEIAKDATDVWSLARALYDEVLVPDAPTLESDGEMPPHVVGLPNAEGCYASLYWAEQIPLAAAAFVYGKGKPESIAACVNFGRDCDTTATTVGAWVGGLCGEKGLPQEWVKLVYESNIGELDIHKLAVDITNLTV